MQTYREYFEIKVSRAFSETTLVRSIYKHVGINHILILFISKYTTYILHLGETFFFNFLNSITFHLIDKNCFLAHFLT